MTNTKQFKIRRAARVIAKGYIKTLEEGKEPLFLSAQVELAKYDILENVNDNRLNMADTLEAVRREAHWMIKDTLGQRPDLAAKLIQFRQESEEAAKAAEVCDKTPEEEILETLEVYGGAASPGLVSSETDLSVQKIVSVAKKSDLFKYKPGYRKYNQGCLKSMMECGYYHAEISIAK